MNVLLVWLLVTLVVYFVAIYVISRRSRRKIDTSDGFPIFLISAIWPLSVPVGLSIYAFSKVHQLAVWLASPK